MCKEKLYYMSSLFREELSIISHKNPTAAKLRKMPQMIYTFSLKEVFHLQK